MLINPGASLLTLLSTSVFTVPVWAAANLISGAEGADTLANDPYPAHGVNGPPPNHGANRGGKSPFEHYTSNPSIPTAGAHYILPYHLSCQVLPTGPKKRFDQDEMKKATLHDAPTGNANEYRTWMRKEKNAGSDQPVWLVYTKVVQPVAGRATSATVITLTSAYTVIGTENVKCDRK